MSEREYVVDWDRYRVYVKEWSFEHGDWPRVSPGHQRDCLALLREVEELEAEVREWICESCKRVYPGVPRPDERNLAGLRCQDCDGLTMPKGIYERKELEKERDILKAKLEEAEKSAKEAWKNYEAVGQAIAMADERMAMMEAERNRLRRKVDDLRAVNRELAPWRIDALTCKTECDRLRGEVEYLKRMDREARERGKRYLLEHGVVVPEEGKE